MCHCCASKQIWAQHVKGNASPCLDDSPEGRLMLDRFTSFLLFNVLMMNCHCQQVSHLIQLPYVLMSKVLQSMTLHRHGHCCYWWCSCWALPLASSSMLVSCWMLMTSHQTSSTWLVSSHLHQTWLLTLRWDRFKVIVKALDSTSRGLLPMSFTLTA